MYTFLAGYLRLNKWCRIPSGHEVKLKNVFIITLPEVLLCELIGCHLEHVHQNICYLIFILFDFVLYLCIWLT